MKGICDPDEAMQVIDLTYVDNIYVIWQPVY